MVFEVVFGGSSPLQAVRKKSFLNLFFLVLLTFPFSLALAEEPEVVPGEYIVRFKKGSEAQHGSLRNQLGVNLLSSTKLTGTQHVRAKSGSSYDHAYAKRLLASGQVEFIEPNYVVSINRTPNDTRYTELWGMHNTGQTGGTSNVDIDAPEAWDVTTGSSSVVVGIVDTGINATHPDLSANMWVNTGEIPNNNIDDDNNGVVDDVHGYNAITNNGNQTDDHGHGSHCAGTIGGTGNNGQGVAGVNWNVKLMGLKFLSASGFGSTQDAIETIQYAVTMKNRGVNIRVLSNSWGGGGFSQALQDAISAANSAGILFVAAAGNNGSDNDASPTYPANYDVSNVISVAALDSNGNLASFSNYGASTVDIGAPGVGILSTTLGSSYASWNGTSMATPHVSGVAALVLGREPSLTVSQLRSRLLTTNKQLSTLSGVVAYAGMVNAHRALTNASSPELPPQPLVSYSKSARAIDYSNTLGTRVLTVDDGYEIVDLGFSFPYYNQTFPKLVISSNGRVIPVASNGTIPTATDYSNRIADGIHIYNDDLVASPLSSQGGVWFASSNGVATITWVAAPYVHRGGANAQAEIRFQLKLTSSGVIEFHYLDTNVGDNAYNNGASASVGLSPVANSSGEKLTISHNTVNAELASNKALSIRKDVTATNKDFDGDGASDLFVWRNGTGMWYVLTSGSNFNFAHHHSYQLGLPGDIPLIGDFDGDAKADLVVWRPTDGTWYFRTSGSQYAVISSIQWGLSGDYPLVGDYDGDGLSDLAVYRQASGSFFVLLSSGGYNRNGAISGSTQAMMHINLGGFGHDLVVGDFTGDGKDDFTVVWQLIRFWTVKDQSNNMLYSLPWGNPGDTPHACDWDTDSVDDRVITRPNSQGTIDWFVAASSGAVYVDTFGSFGDRISCDKDYDGDGIIDRTIFRNSTGEWYIKQSTTNTLRKIQFGLPGDITL